MKQIAALLLGLLGASLLLGSDTVRAADRPNVLWLVCEDATSTWFGCYGNSEAKTPNVDAFARQGFRYTHVYASAPVCAPSRSTWITGINAVTTGTLPMRSRYPVPHDLIKYYPDYLREAGYYTANHVKTDYNIGGRPDTACWDSAMADGWNHRKPGQPFFQVINYMESHESRAFGDVTHTRHSPNDVSLAKYHPDELGIRQNYAKYYDAVENMDREFGKTLAALDKAGLADDTIVIFNSDHGGVMPRSKRFLFDSGTHCPLIIRIPEKYKSLWPAEHPGMTVDRLVSYLDMPKTWLSITGAHVPDVMQGRIFLGAAAELEPQYVFSFRERMDERYDSQRSVRDKRYVYIKNYMPYVAWGQHLNYMWKLVAMRVWEDAYIHHRTNEVTGRFFQLKPVEELYDMEADPDNVVNLAYKPEYQSTIATLRGQLRGWQLAVHDSGLLPEVERLQRAEANHTTIYQMVQDPTLYDLPAYLDAADLALSAQRSNTPRLIEFLASKDSAIRYWGAVGMLMLGKPDSASQAALESVLADPCGEVRLTAAWVLIEFGNSAKARQAIVATLQKHEPTTLFALNVLDWMHGDITPYLSAMDSLNPSLGAMAGNEQLMVQYLRKSHGLQVPLVTERAGNAAKKKNKQDDL